jgi:hypothetical protein
MHNASGKHSAIQCKYIVNNNMQLLLAGFCQEFHVTHCQALQDSQYESDTAPEKQ